MKTKRHYTKQINEEYEKLAKKKGVKLNSNAYRKMAEFAWDRFCEDYDGPITLNVMFKFNYTDAIHDLTPDRIKLYDRVKKKLDFVGSPIPVPVIKDAE